MFIKDIENVRKITSHIWNHSCYAAGLQCVTYIDFSASEDLPTTKYITIGNSDSKGYFVPCHVM